MKLFSRREPEPTKHEQVMTAVRLGARALAAQRVARRSVRHYRFTKKAITVAGLGAITIVVLKKVKGGDSTPSYTPPPAASTGPPSGTGAPAPAGVAPVNGSAASGSDVTDALTDAGVEGSGPDTQEEAGDAGDTVEELGIEAPNQATPPPPKGAKGTKGTKGSKGSKAD